MTARVTGAAIGEQLLETARLFLEPLTVVHAAQLLEPLQEPDLYQFVPEGPPESLGILVRRYEAWSRRASPDGAELWLNWAAISRESGLPVGWFQATVQPGALAIVAYFVFKPYWRQGYAKEGTSAVISHLFEKAGVERVVAEMDTRNDPSIRLVESLGFTKVATTYDAGFFDGQTSHEHRYELGQGGNLAVQASEVNDVVGG